MAKGGIVAKSAINIQGYIDVYESSDGGTGDDSKTVWQFFIKGQPLLTNNRCLAETMRFAIETSSPVEITYDEGSNIISQTKLKFKYDCETIRHAPCEPRGPKGSTR